MLVDAGLVLLGTEGAVGTTVRAVCHNAELNPRYFYESFEDIDALIVAVYDKVIGDLAVVIGDSEAEARAAKTPLHAARIGIGRIVRFVDEDRRRARILYVESVSHAALSRHRIEVSRQAVVTLEERAVAAAGSWPAGEHVGRIGAAMLIGGVSEVLLDWIDGRIKASRDQLIEDLAVIALALGEATEKIARQRVLQRKSRS